VGPLDGSLGLLPRGSKVTTLELNPLLQIQRDQVVKNYPDVVIENTLVGNIEDVRQVLPQGNCFDVIICTHVVCCVKNKEKAVKEMHRLLKPNGRLLFLDIVMYDKKRNPLSFWLQRLLHPVHRFVSLGCRAGGYDAEALISRNGFDVSGLKYTFDDSKPFPYQTYYHGSGVKM